MKAINLDALLPPGFAEATFHDSELCSIALDWEAARADLEFAISVAGDSLRRGVLHLEGLFFFAAEAPHGPTSEWLGKPLWIASDGPFPDPSVATSLKGPKDLPVEAICHFLYASNTNAFIVFAASAITFSWRGGAA